MSLIAPNKPTVAALRKLATDYSYDAYYRDDQVAKLKEKWLEALCYDFATAPGQGWKK